MGHPQLKRIMLGVKLGGPPAAFTQTRWRFLKLLMGKRIQIGLAIILGVAAIRTGDILYERSEANKTPAPKQEVALPEDYYVVPRRLRAYDLKSAQQLKDQPVWVKQGYRFTYYAYDPATQRVNFAHEAGLLLPLEKLQITKVMTDTPPKGSKQVMAVFEKDGRSYAFPIGIEQDGDYQIYADNIVFIQDPHELYKHWPPDIWTAVDAHEVKLGMNELQTEFAVGMGMPESAEETSTKTVHYANGGKPLVVVFQNGKATEVKQEAISGS